MAKNDMKKDNKNFGKELKSELKKVTWPTFKELVNNTSAVISIVVIVAAIVFILDVCFENLNKFGVEKLKKLVSSDTETTEQVDENSELLEDETELIDSSETTTEVENVVSEETVDENNISEEVTETSDETNQ